MDMDDLVLKRISKISIAAIAVLLIGAFIFYKEHVFFADAAYVIFNILNYDALAIQFNRYGSFITQIVPYLGQKMHLPLQTIFIGYAISFSVFYLTIASLLVYRYKQYGLAILMGLYYFLIVSDSHFWISEIPQGIGWMFLFFGVIIYLGHKKTSLLLIIVPFIILSFLTIFTHFVIIIPTVFLWVYFITDKNNWPFSRKNTIILSILLAGVIYAKFFIATAFPSGDAPHLKGVLHVSVRDIYYAFKTPVVRMFCHRTMTNYWTSVLVLVLGIIGLLKADKKLLAAWVLACGVGYFAIMGLTYGDQDEHVQLFHIESEWTCIGIIIATPFVFSFLPKLKLSYAASLLGFIFIVRLVYIGFALPAFSWRIHFQEQVLAQMQKKGIKKLALYRDWNIKPKYMIDWGSGYESLMTSAMNGSRPNLTFSFVDHEINPPVKEAITDTRAIYLWERLPYGSLNQKYFMMDTTQIYQVMTYEELMK